MFLNCKIFNPIVPGLFGFELTWGEVSPPCVTLLSLKLCDPNLVQRYFEKSISSAAKKNRIKQIMTSL